MIKAIIFDLDGVILESVDIKTKAFKRLFEKNSPGQLRKILRYHAANMGVSRFVKFRYIYKNILKLPLTVKEEKDLGMRFSKLVLAEVLKSPFVAGANEFLKKNFKKYVFFIASGTPQKELLFIAKKRGFSGYFNKIYGSPPGKTEIVRDILLKKHFMPGEVVFVGDAQTDLKAARETGVRFVARIKNVKDRTLKCKYRIRDLRRLGLLVKSFSLSI